MDTRCMNVSVLHFSHMCTMDMMEVDTRCMTVSVLHFNTCTTDTMEVDKSLLGHP